MSRELLRPTGVQTGVSCAEALSATAWHVQVQGGPAMMARSKIGGVGDYIMGPACPAEDSGGCPEMGVALVMFQPRGYELSSIGSSCHWLRCGGVRRGGRGPMETRPQWQVVQGQTRAMTVRRKTRKGLMFLGGRIGRTW